MFYKLAALFLLAVCTFNNAHAFAQLDDNEAQQKLRVYALKYTDCDSAAHLIGDVIEGQSIRMSTDARTNSLIIRADDKSHERVDNLLKMLDVSRVQTPDKEYGNVSIQLLWIVDVPQDQEEEFQGLKDPPASIKELLSGKLRERLAINNPKLGTQLYLKCQPGSDGRGETSSEGIGEIGEMHEFSISCNTFLQVQENGKYSVELDIQAGIDGKESVVSTKILTIDEHPVCLAIAPIGGVDSLFIVRVFND